MSEIKDFEACTDIFPEEINIKILKNGFVHISIGDAPIGLIQEFDIVASADAVMGNVAKFHVKQFSIDVSEDGETFENVLHEFDGVSEFISGQKLINPAPISVFSEEQLEQIEKGVDDDN